MKLDLSIIIINYNTRDLLYQCLKSILKNKNNFNLEILVIDNASRDNSVEMVRKNFPKIKLIINKENLGFPKAVNLGLKRIYGRNILLLNPDTKILRKAIPKMVKFLDQNKKVGAVGPKIYGARGQILCSARPLINLFDCIFSSSILQPWKLPSSIRLPLRFLFHEEKYLKTCFFAKHPFKINGLLSGSCFMIKKEVIDKIGPKDPKLYFFGEESDWCKKILKSGYKIYFLPEAKIIHYIGQSTKRRDKKSLFEYSKLIYRDRLYFQNKVYYCRKNFPKFPLWILKFSIILELGLKILFQIFNIRNPEERKTKIKVYWQIKKEILFPKDD